MQRVLIDDDDSKAEEVEERDVKGRGVEAVEKAAAQRVVLILPARQMGLAIMAP